MQLKTAGKNYTLRLSQSDWLSIGEEAGWIVVSKRGDAKNLAKHYKDEKHPFTKCKKDMKEEGYGEEAADNICGKVKNEVNAAVEKTILKLSWDFNRFGKLRLRNQVIDEYMGWKLKVYDDVEEDNVKRFHTAISPGGEEIPLQFSPYVPGVEEFRLWVDLKLPPSNNGRNWYLKDLKDIKGSHEQQSR